MQLTSPVFTHQGIVPEEYAFKGKNRNPPLFISQVPARAISLALIMHDPDAWGGRDFLHWIVWNIPKNTTIINENTLPEDAVMGTNDKGVAGYMRPAPLKGSGTHHYIFELHALDALLDLPQGADRLAAQAAISAHTIERAELVGLYARQDGRIL